MNDSEIPTGTGIAWAIQQINKHFDNLAASNRTGADSRTARSVITEGPLPSNPLNDPENPRYGSGDETRVVPSLKNTGRPSGAAETVQPNTLSGSDGMPVGDTLRDSAKTIRRPEPSQRRSKLNLKTLEQEFYRPGDFGADSSGFLTKPQEQSPEETGKPIWVQPRVVATIHYSGKNFVGETLVQKEKMDDLWKQ